uniref:Protein kinase domain-containing protein n=1 Tax=Oryza meridionalis TaxID=40149 RepID=A0A0E0CQ97_9ORYZ
MEVSGREVDAAGPPWRPSESTAFLPFAAAAAGDRAGASLSGRRNGLAARSSNLSSVRKRPFVARLTTDIVQTFGKCNPEFKYSDSLNPKRFLTNPSVPAHNDGLDNANSDLILYVNLELVNKKSDRRYVIKEMLGQGTFGQVAKCWDAETNSYVAVKVIKNQPAFYQQAIMEVSLLSMLNEKYDPDDQHHIVRMLDFFLYQNHLCIAFEMLGHNLYELLKRNSLRGLQLKYVRTFSRQILDALVVMKDAGIIHCDLKPENILITPNVKTAAGVKVIDFGSACLEGKTIYSVGITDLRNEQPPDDLLREAKNTGRFFKQVGSIYPGIEVQNGPISAYRILTEEEIETRESKKPKVGRWYFPRGRLDKLIYTYPWKNLNGENLPETEKTDRLALVDFLRGLVEFDPNKRWSPLQASYHPFITGEAFTGPYEPIQETPRIPVGRVAAVDHNPGGGHWLAAGLSPQVVGSINRGLPFNNAFAPKIPFSYGSSCGSFGSHGSFNENVGLASSYGSYDVNSVNMYHSPLGPSGFNLHSQAGGTFLGSSPDIRRRSYLYHGGGIRLSPGCPGPMSLGASPSQFTPPNSQMQIPSTATGKYGSTSPARSSHGSLGKAAAVGQYNRRRNLGHPPISMPPHEYTSQLIQGHHGDGTISNHFDGYARGHSGYPQSALPNPGHFSWRPHTGAGSGLSTDTSNHGSFPPSRYGGFPPSHSSNVSADTLASTSSIPDPADWDPNYSEESLLQEDTSLSDALSDLHLKDASGQTNQSSRLAHIQSHAIANSNSLSMNQSRHGQPFQRYNHMTASYLRPMGNHHNGQPVWPNYGMAEPPPATMADGMPWGGRPGHSFTAGGLPSSFAGKDFGRIF